MSLRCISSLVCLWVFAFSTTLAHATTWTYSFSGSNAAPGGNGLPVGFQYSAPARVTSNTSLFSTQLGSCSNCLNLPNVPAVTLQPSNVFGSSVDFNDILNTGNVFMFPFGAFVNPGTYLSASPFNPGTLNVQLADKASVSPTVAPEPNTVVLLLGGLVCIFVGVRGKSK